MARPVTSIGEMIAALASAGTLYLLSNQNVILTRWGCGSILSTLPTGTPRMRTSSPGNTAVLLSKYPTTIVRPICVVARTATNSDTASTTARMIARPTRTRRSLGITADLPAAGAVPHSAQARRRAMVSVAVRTAARVVTVRAGLAADRLAAGAAAAAR